MKIEKGKLYLVTGGSGFLGDPLIKYILSCGGNVRALSRNEGNIVELKGKYPAIDIYIGDICDKFVVRQAVYGVNGIFHLAASKHVGLAEKFVRETMNTNIVGSLNLLEETLNSDIEFILGISTDKAAQVSGVYGATKLMMERLFKQFEQLNPKCQYRIVRYGNVLFSTGSVLCKWKELISNGKEIIITEPKATRFFWSVEQAIDVIVDCMNTSTSSEPYCPNMKAMSIENLAAAMIKKYSGGKDINIKVIGLQPGENFHEKVLDAGPYSNEVEQFTIDEIMELI